MKSRRFKFQQLEGHPPLQTAVSDRSDTVVLHVYDRDQGNFGVSRLDPAAGARDGVEVSARPLDDLLDEHDVGEIDLMKMDIEGAETRALDGLRRTLAAQRVRRLLLELHPALLIGNGRTPRMVLDQVTAHGYEAWRIDHSVAATRRAAYGRRCDPMAVIERDEGRAPVDPWPHLLMVRSGLEPTPCSP